MVIFHKHKYSKWTFHSYSARHYDEEYWKERYCLSCGYVEQVELTYQEYMEGIKESENDIKGIGS